MKHTPKSLDFAKLWILVLGVYVIGDLLLSRLFHHHRDTAKTLVMGAMMGTCWVVLMAYVAKRARKRQEVKDHDTLPEDDTNG